MAGVLALVLLVPGSLLVVGAMAIVWTGAFVIAHAAGVIASGARAAVRQRIPRRAGPAVPVVELPVVLPKVAA